MLTLVMLEKVCTPREDRICVVPQRNNFVEPVILADTSGAWPRARVEPPDHRFHTCAAYLSNLSSVFIVIEHNIAPAVVDTEL